MAAYKMGNQSLDTRKRNSSIPVIGTTTTIGDPLGYSSSQYPAIGQSYNKMFGGSGASSMGDLEAASMRLADAASRREIAESEADYDFKAMTEGYSSLDEMQRDIRKRRKRSGI